MNLTTEREMRNLLKAHYRLLYVVTWEEKRCQQMLFDIIQENKNMDMYAWTLATGLVKVGDNSPPQEMQPEELLTFIKEHKGEALFLLKDFHPFLNDALVVRGLRDITSSAGQNYKPIVMTSPTMKVPIELEKSVQVVDFDLPSPEQIRTLVEAAQSEIEARTGVTASPDEIEKLVKACQGLTVDEVENVLAKSWVEKTLLSVDTILEEKKQIIRKSGVLEYYDNLEEFTDVGGMDLLKEWLEKRTTSFTDSAREFGLPQPKGVLLLGIQGCGKSLLCKAIAGLWKLPMIRLDVGRIMHGIVGSSEENMRKAINVAKSISPCILFIDEIEKGLSGTGSSNFSDGGTTSRVFSTLLTWLQDKEEPVFVIATANDVTQLPAELLRKGRFDEIFFVALPHHEERKEIFEIHIRKRNRKPEDFDLCRLADATEGFSGAEIEQAIVDGMYDAFDAGSDINTEILTKAIKNTVPLSRTMEEKIKASREWARTKTRFASSSEAKEMQDVTANPKQNINPFKFRLKD